MNKIISLQVINKSSVLLCSSCFRDVGSFKKSQENNERSQEGGLYYLTIGNFLQPLKRMM